MWECVFVCVLNTGALFPATGDKTCVRTGGGWVSQQGISTRSNYLKKKKKTSVKEGVSSCCICCCCCFLPPPSPCTSVSPFSDGLAAFWTFLKSEYSDENLEFWMACEVYKNIKNSSKLVSKANKIYMEFIDSQAPREVCVLFRCYTHS